MDFYRATRENCHQCSGVVVVIDVLRAFTTAPVALSRGADRIYLVSSVEEALALRNELPNAKTLGEVKGLKPDGFDYSNSPVALLDKNLRGIPLIQRTSAGTQGVVNSVKAETLMAASFVNAEATARYVRNLNPIKVTFVITETTSDEDFVCADYLETLLRGEKPDFTPFAERVRASKWCLHSRAVLPPDLAADKAFALSLDKFDFPMPVQKKDGRLFIDGIFP